MSDWKDVTSYSYSTPEDKRVPRILEQRSGDLLLTVHRFVGCEGWFATCHALGIDKHDLGDVTLRAAQRNAVAFARAQAHRLAAASRKLVAPRKTKP